MPLPIANRRPRRIRPVPLAYAVAAGFGVVSAFLFDGFSLLNEFGSRYPVETVLVAILICGVATLCWAGAQMLRDAARHVDELIDEELRRRESRDDQAA